MMAVFLNIRDPPVNIRDPPVNIRDPPVIPIEITSLLFKTCA